MIFSIFIYFFLYFLFFIIGQYSFLQFEVFISVTAFQLLLRQIFLLFSFTFSSFRDYLLLHFLRASLHWVTFSFFCFLFVIFETDSRFCLVFHFFLLSFSSIFFFDYFAIFSFEFLRRRFFSFTPPGVWLCRQRFLLLLRFADTSFSFFDAIDCIAYFLYHISHFRYF